jgi:hypothetical protein
VEVQYFLNLGDIPIIVVNVNQTESRDLVNFDKTCQSKNMIANSGTFVNVGRNHFMPCNNLKYSITRPDSRDE